MKTTAYWLTLCATALAVVVLWTLHSVQANAADLTTVTYVSTQPTDTTVRSTILDNTSYPEIVARLECSGSDISDMVSSCATALRSLCPDGGTVKELGETPAGVIPARIEIVVACRHEPSDA